MRLALCLPILAVLASPTHGQWVTDELSGGRYLLSSTTVGGKAIFAGGFVGSAIRWVDIFDVNTNGWTQANLSAPRGWLTSGTVGTKAMFAGGAVTIKGGPSDVVDIYDDSTGTWSTATLSARRYGLAAASLGDRLFVAGGWDNGPNGGPSDVVDIYDDSTGLWSVASLSVARTDLAAASLGTKVLFAGGWNGAPCATVDIYDNATSTWSTASLSKARARLSATAVGSKILFAGGFSTTAGDEDVVDIYEVGLGTWSAATLSVPRELLAATSVGSLAIFAGGWEGPAALPSLQVDIYDDATGQWTISSLSKHRYGLTATTVANKAMFAGGMGKWGGLWPRVDIYRFFEMYPFCTGDVSSGTPCPCGNDNDGSLQGSGCANNFFLSGAQLTGSGAASKSEDTLVLSTIGLEPQSSGLYFQADNDLSPGALWGDGLRCAGGQLRRLGVALSDANGYSDTSGFALPISVQVGNTSAGFTKYYQCWYRSPLGSACGFGFNSSNGLGVVWLP